MSSIEQTSEASVAVVSGRVVTREQVIEGGVRIEGDRIVDVGSVDCDADTVIEANGRLVIPGLIDLHGDDIERHLHPRSGARMALPMALASADRANISAGSTPSPSNVTTRRIGRRNSRRRWPTRSSVLTVCSRTIACTLAVK